MALKSTQLLREMNTSGISWREGGVKAAGAQGWQPCHLHVPIVLEILGTPSPWGPKDLFSAVYRDSYGTYRNCLMVVC